MKVAETREKMIEVIRSVEIGGKTYGEYVNELCDRLMEAGAFVPPVKCGETVFAACPALDELDEDVIEDYKIHGYGVDVDGDIFVLDAGREISYIDTMFCNLTREDAEMWLKRRRRDE